MNEDFFFVREMMFGTRSSFEYSQCKSCGSSGAFLLELADCGLTRLAGCDPFISGPVTKKGVIINKCTVDQMTGTYDTVFLHHSFEHLPNPRESLSQIRQLQEKDGRCIIRVPTTSSEAFERYQANWVQLDAPRHLTIPSRQGMKSLASVCGYELEKMIDDSSGFSFWGSEQYLKDIPLQSPCSYLNNREGSMFTSKEIRKYDQIAAELNNHQRGDQTAFIFIAVLLLLKQSKIETF